MAAFCILCKPNFYQNNRFLKLHRDAGSHLSPSDPCATGYINIGLIGQILSNRSCAEDSRERERKGDRERDDSQYLHCIWCHISQASITTDIRWPSDKTTAFKTSVKGVFMFHDVNHMRDGHKCIWPHHICSVDAIVSAYSKFRPQ